MANPRKFSEKIALHHQKQAEETAAFEEIMRDVANVTNKVSAGGGGGASVRGLAPALGPLRAGSLPDVSLQTPPPDEGPLSQYGASPDSGSGMAAMHAHMHQSQQQQHHQQHQHGGTSPGPGGAQTRGRPAGVGPMRARPMDRKIDTSPYGSTAYLSPPPDSSWRRTNSDSALHQSSGAVPRDTSPHHHAHSPQQGGYQGQVYSHSHHTSGNGSPQQIQGGGHSYQGGGNLLQQHHHYSHSHQGLNTALLHHSRRDGNLDGLILDANTNRPRSSCEVPRVPGIHIYPSAHDTGGVQIPVSSNTGSLPDLTSVHFPPQLHNATALHGDHQGTGTPYSTSPASASPATLSPTSVATTARSGASPHHSPRHSPHGSPTTPHHQYTNHNQSMTLESPWMSGSYQQQCSPPSLHSSHSNINIPSPTMGVSPAQISNNGGYRSPRSPGSSPGGVGSNSNGSTASSGNHHNSASASSNTNNTNNSNNNSSSSNINGVGGDSPNYDYSQGDNYYINQALQHHFEQFSMDWAQLVQSLVESGVTWTAQVQTDSPSPGISYINSVNTTQTPFLQTRLGGVEGDAGGGGGGGGGVWAGGGPCLSGPAPNTPTTIPDIILTDFSNPTVSKELSNSLASQISKELSASIGGHFETSLFPEDEGLRDSLGPIDFDGFQMLTDPGMNVISDPTTEDVFRQDRL